MSTLNCGNCGDLGYTIENDDELGEVIVGCPDCSVRAMEADPNFGEKAIGSDDPTVELPALPESFYSILDDDDTIELDMTKFIQDMEDLETTAELHVLNAVA